IRTLPYVTSWYEKYKDQGLVIVGVHTPEFDFERRTENVRDAIKRYKITYPVAQDNDYATWQAYENRYWPAKYLIDQSGQIVYTHFGEGKYEETENQIRKLLGLSGQADTAEDKRSMAKTPEIYFGLLRQEFFASQTPPAPKATVYEFPDHIPANHFSLEGEWRFEKEFAELVGPSGKIGLNFYASKVHLVAESKHGKPIKVRVTVDGVMRRELEIAGADLYTLAELEKPGEHILEIEVLSPGLLVFTFTFG
ncbi:MAG: redoxin domain-containing protein, partial [Candidatus Doudnabacteria bacterium]|nr:redoxin domain-containing protein [Candidatus Doudnabacteria bacterium]